MEIADVTTASIVAVCAVVGVALSISTLVYGWVRDRQRHRADSEKEAHHQDERLDALVLAFFGRTAPNESGLPPVEGFMDGTNRRLEHLERP